MVVRRARATDTDAVLGFATRTWNDWDYVPQAWPRWLDATDGALLVGTPGMSSDGETPLDANGQPLDAGQPVAVVRVTLVAPGEAWLEAIRVDPRVRGLDIATDLQIAELHWAVAQGATVVRYATSARNEASHRLGARGGFTLLTSFVSHWWSASGDPEGDDHQPSGFLPDVEAAAAIRRAAFLDRLAHEQLTARMDETEEVWSRLNIDDGFTVGARLYEPRPWALEELTQAKFGRHVERGEVLIDRADRGWAVAILTRKQRPAEDAALRFALLVGDGSAALRLIQKCRELAGESIRFRVATDARMVADHASAFRDSGYVFPDWTLHLLSRPIDREHPLPPISAARVVLAEPPRADLVPPD